MEERRFISTPKDYSRFYGDYNSCKNLYVMYEYGNEYYFEFISLDAIIIYNSAGKIQVEEIINLDKNKFEFERIFQGIVRKIKYRKVEIEDFI